MAFILWVIAVILVIAGIVTIIRGQVLWGIVLIIVGLLVGPGGVSIFDDDDSAPLRMRPTTSLEASSQS
jgi:TM2 domain-containing membrane protein YozV